MPINIILSHNQLTKVLSFVGKYSKIIKTALYTTLSPKGYNRGYAKITRSCTGNPPTRNGYDAAKELFEAKLKGLDRGDLDAALREIFENQRTRLAKYLNLPEGAEVILCPSGSDAEYLPIAIARALQPEKDIFNGVTQLHEIGAGSEPASTGKFFSKYAPFLGDHGLGHLSGFERVGGVVVSARDKDGKVLNASEEMAQFSDKYLDMNSYPIVHGKC